VNEWENDGESVGLIATECWYCSRGGGWYMNGVFRKRHFSSCKFLGKGNKIMSERKLDIVSFGAGGIGKVGIQ